MPVVKLKKTLHIDKRAGDLLAEGAGDADDLMTISAVADWLGVSLIWLHIGRQRGYGPAFLKLAPRHIRYKRSDVLAWLESRRRLRTSEYARPKRKQKSNRRRREMRLDATT